MGAGNNGGQNPNPVGEVRFESDLVAITIAQWFASDIRQNKIATTGREELLGGLVETYNTFLPFCLGAFGLRIR